ncbi:MAG: hypothetical protein PHQ36_11155 [Anaerolineales bacterium]|nr:hypothetical protein [Anaerolineales bacterium]
MSSHRRESFLSILLIVFAAIATYGALISHLGFYRDDWYLLWTAQSQGTQGILKLFAGDRPFDGWLYSLDFWMMGLSPLRWHLYALGVKIVSALAFFWLLRSLWQNRKLETTFVALLFVVYPGFYQQPNALTYKQLLIAYAAALLSLALTVNAVKAGKIAYKILFTLAAMALSVFYILIYEALVSMEVVRVLLLVYLFYRQNKTWKENLRVSLTNALPYFLFSALFVYWRIFLFHSTRKATSVEGLADSYSSLHGFVRFFVETGKDLVKTSFLAWGIPLYQFSNQVVYKEMGQAVGLALFVILLGAGYYWLTKNQLEDGKGAESESALDWIILGALVIFITTLPIVAAGRNVIFGVQWDRYTYQSAFGVALLMGGIIFYAIKGNLRWILLIALLASGVMTQFFSANYYRDFWKTEREAWWQLTWRAPQIKDGTTLVVSLPGGYALAEEYEVWAPVNMIYHPDRPVIDLAGQIMFGDIWLDFARGTQERRIVRGTIAVPRDYGKAIILSQPSPRSCLHVLDGKRFEQAAADRVEIRQIAQYSRADLIEPAGQPPIPPRETFGDEPPHTWCYYYQKMDLARQTEDWQTVADLAD